MRAKPRSVRSSTASLFHHGAIDNMIAVLRATFGLHLQRTHSGGKPACDPLPPPHDAKARALTAR
jgi:hypothetical protein